MKIANFTFEKPEMKFSDLDTPYQYHFIKEFALTGAAFVAATLFIIIFMTQWLYILVALLAAAGYSLYILWQIYKSLTNKVLVVDAKCIDLERKENKLLGPLSKDATIQDLHSNLRK